MYCPTKHSARFYASHQSDGYTDLGFDYRGKIFKKTMSPMILQNKVNKNILSRVEDMIVYLIDSVKQIKTQYMISVDKNDRNLN